MKSPQWTSFIAGAVSAYVTIRLLNIIHTKRQKTIEFDGNKIREDGNRDKKEETKNGTKHSHDNKDDRPLVMDSVDLGSQRILRKAEGALQLRTSRLIIVVERCTNDHNYSAILRSAEALGVQHVWIIAPQAMQKTLSEDKRFDGAIDSKNESNTQLDDKDTTGKEIMTEEENENEKVSIGMESNGDKPLGKRAQQQKKDKRTGLYSSSGKEVRSASQSEVRDRAMHHLFAQRAMEWLSVKEFDTTADCISALRKEGYQIWSTDLSQEAVRLTRRDLERSLSTISSSSSSSPNTTSFSSPSSVIPDKLAIVFGTEAVGCTSEILEASDKRVYLPLRGFADSLNLSVAAALVVHQLFLLDPTIEGSMPQEERIQLRRKWYSKLASQRILTHSQKTRKKWLIQKIRTFEVIEGKKKDGHCLQPQQIEKLDKLKDYRVELQQMETQLEKASLRAIEDLITNPVEPIGDMRRADEHRTTYVSKNTKKLHSEEWDDMPATKYYNTHDQENLSSSFFRKRANVKNIA